MPKVHFSLWDFLRCMKGSMLKGVFRFLQLLARLSVFFIFPMVGKLSRVCLELRKTQNPKILQKRTKKKSRKKTNQKNQLRPQQRKMPRKNPISSVRKTLEMVLNLKPPILPPKQKNWQMTNSGHNLIKFS